jgi:hypothetical protein
LAGGKLTFNSTKVKPLSLCSVTLRDVEEEASDPDGKKARFNISTLERLYQARPTPPPNVPDMNLYQFTASYYDCAPNFFGYNDIPTWPLQEDFSKAMLFLYPPRGSKKAEELEVVQRHNGSYADALAEFLMKAEFPREILVPILRKKLNWQFDSNDVHALDAPPESTPTEKQRKVEAFEQATNAEGANDSGGGGDEHDADLEEKHLERLNDGGPTVDWAEFYDLRGLTWLETHTAEFYKALGSGNLSEPFYFHDEAKNHPRNAGSYKQKLLIGLHILALKQWNERLPYLCARESRYGQVVLHPHHT